MQERAGPEKPLWYTLPPPLPPLPAVHLTLLVPELIWPEPNDQLTLGRLSTPGFERFNAHAALQCGPRQAFEETLGGCFGFVGKALAPLRLLGEADPVPPADSYWLCADPVHLRFHHERIVLADAGAFELSADETGALIGALNAEFGDLGQFHAADPRRWYLRLHAAVDHVAEPLSAIAGKRVAGDPLGAKSPLAGILNEIQMFLHNHPVNQRRAGSGQPAVNSLWLWGGGTLPSVSNADYAKVWSDDPLAIGLARAAGIPARPQPASLAEVLAEAEADKAQLVVLAPLLGPVLYENADDWRQAWQALDSDWFAPLAKALGRQITTLRLVAPTIYGTLSWSDDGSSRWKFWKKGRGLAEIAQELGGVPQ